MGGAMGLALVTHCDDEFFGRSISWIEETIFCYLFDKHYFSQVLVMMVWLRHWLVSLLGCDLLDRVVPKYW